MQLGGRNLPLILGLVVGVCGTCWCSDCLDPVAVGASFLFDEADCCSGSSFSTALTKDGT